MNDKQEVIDLQKESNEKVEHKKKKQNEVIVGGDKLDAKVILCFLAIILLLIVIGLPPILRVMYPAESTNEPTANPTPTPYIPIETDAPTNVTGDGVITCTLYKEESNISILDAITLSYKKKMINSVEQVSTYTKLDVLAGDNGLLDSYATKCATENASYSTFDGVDMICNSSNDTSLTTYLIIDFNEFFEEDLKSHKPPITLEFSSGSNINDEIDKYSALGYTCIGQ